MQVIIINKEVEEFIFSFGPKITDKILRYIELLERFGYQLRPPVSKKIGLDLFELRVVGKLNIRILYTFHKGAALIVFGFVKKTQETPWHVIYNALRRVKQIKST